jgi:hypothetical protein
MRKNALRMTAVLAFAALATPGSAEQRPTDLAAVEAPIQVVELVEYAQPMPVAAAPAAARAGGSASAPAASRERPGADACAGGRRPPAAPARGARDEAAVAAVLDERRHGVLTSRRVFDLAAWRAYSRQDRSLIPSAQGPSAREAGL